MYDERRLKSEMNTARRLGYENGHKEGVIAGYADGKEEGRVEGRAEGKAELIRRMHAKGMSASEISNIVEIEITEIEKILSM